MHSYVVLVVESCAFSKTGGLFCSHLFCKVADSQMKFEDGKEFEPTGNAFQVKGAFANDATLAAPLNRLPQYVSVFMSGSPRFWCAMSGG